MAVCSCVLGKDTDCLFPFEPVVVAWPDEKLETETKKVLCVGVVGQKKSAWFIQRNKRYREDPSQIPVTIQLPVFVGGFVLK